MAHVYTDGNFYVEKLAVDYRLWYDTDDAVADLPPVLTSDGRYLERWLGRMNGSGPVIIAHDLDDINKPLYDNDGCFVSGLLVDSLYDGVDSKSSESHITIFYKAGYPYNFMVHCSCARRSGRTTYASRIQPVVIFHAQPESGTPYKYSGKSVCDAVSFTWHSPITDPAFNFISSGSVTTDTLGFEDSEMFELTKGVMLSMVRRVVLDCMSNIGSFRQFCIDRPGKKDPRYWNGGSRTLPSTSLMTYGAATGKPEPQRVSGYPKPNPKMYQWWYVYNSGLDLPARVRLAFATAYRAAIERIDVGYVPMISYAFDIKDMLTGKPRARNLVRDARQCYSAIKDMWMKYRYAYSTTKADVHELIELSDYLMELGRAQSQLISSSGEYTDHGATFKVSLELAPQELIPKGKLDALIKRVGVIGPYEVWDLIPFSFIVDWFADIGGLLESLERWNERMSLSPTNIWFTCQYSDDTTDTFFRIRGYKPKEFGFVTDHQATKTTLFKRMIDGVCLFTR